MSDYSLRVRVGGSAAAATLWTSLTQVRVRVAYGGGYMLGVAVSLESAVSSTSHLLSFDSVYIHRAYIHSARLTPAATPDAACDSCSHATAGVNAAAHQSLQVHLVGGGLGFVDYCGAVRVGATASPRTRWQADSSILALTGGGEAAGVPLSVTVGGGAAPPACSGFSLCRINAHGLTRAYTLSESVTYDIVRIRSLVEHVVTVTPVRVSPSYFAEGLDEASNSVMESVLGLDPHAFFAFTNSSETHASNVPAHLPSAGACVCVCLWLYVLSCACARVAWLFISVK